MSDSTQTYFSQQISSRFLVVILISVEIYGQVDKSPHLTACILAERGSNDLIYNFDKSAAAVELARIYANDAILPNNISLKIVYMDIGRAACSPRNHIMAYAMKQLGMGINCNVYIGAGCGFAAEALYDLASFFETPLIGCPVVHFLAAGVGIRIPISEYPFLSRVSVTHQKTADVLLHFLNSENYTSPTVFIDTSNSFFEELGNALETQIRRGPSRDLVSGARYAEVTKEIATSPGRLGKMLGQYSQKSRVFILLVPLDILRQIMVTAYFTEMTSGDYVFVGVYLFPSSSFGEFSTSDYKTWIGNIVLQPLLFLTLESLPDSNHKPFSSDVKKLSAAQFNYTFKKNEEVDLVTSHYYDAIIFYAHLVRDLAVSGHDFTNGNLVARLSQNSYSFMSPVNDLVQLDNNGDRLMSYVIKNYNPDRRKFVEYLRYSGNGTVTQLGDLIWPNGNALPPNRPFCGFSGEDDKCKSDWSLGILIISIVIPVISTGIIALVAFSVYKKYEKKHSLPYWWRIHIQNLIFLHPAQRNISLTSFLEAGSCSQVSMTDEGVIIERATYQEEMVTLIGMKSPHLRLDYSMDRTLRSMKHVQHAYLQKFYGIAVSAENVCLFIVGEYCSKRSLTELLLSRNNTFSLNWNFKSSLLKDAASGMDYIHSSSSLYSHGDLSSNCCLIDSNFVLKIADYGLGYFRPESHLESIYEECEERDYNMLCWRSPELLRDGMSENGTQKGDVYSYAIIMQQIILRSRPYRSFDETKSEDISSQEILMEVARGTVPPLRPRVPLSACPPTVHALMEECWNELPEIRPTFSKIKTMLGKILGKAGDNIVDQLINSMEKHAFQLEAEAEQRMRQFGEEKRRSEELLSNMLPKTIAQALVKGVVIAPETYSSTTVYFGDIDGFAELISEAKTPHQTIEILNTLYSTCDSIIENFDVYKVETVKDSYLIASGLPMRNGIKHAGELASLALRLRREISSLKFSFESHVKLKLRVGLHSGPCVAAVIGTKMPRYCLFGDTINTASRMETHGEGGKIHCSSSTNELLVKLKDYILVPRGMIDIKGKGPLETFWLVGKDHED